MRQSRIILADKHANMMGGVYRLLKNEAQSVLMVADKTSLYHALERNNPDVLVVDLSFLSSVESVEIDIAWMLKKDFPALKIIVLSLHEEKTVTDNVMAAGVAGYVLKRRAVIDLIPALHEVLDGRKYISQDIDGES